MGPDHRTWFTLETHRPTGRRRGPLGARVSAWHGAVIPLRIWHRNSTSSSARPQSWTLRYAAFSQRGWCAESFWGFSFRECKRHSHQIDGGDLRDTRARGCACARCVCRWAWCIWELNHPGATRSAHVRGDLGAWGAGRGVQSGVPGVPLAQMLYLHFHEPPALRLPVS